MNGSPNTSFIPKHNPNKIERKSSPRQLFIGTIIVRVLFFVVLVVAVGVFFYERRVNTQLASEVAAFQDQTERFDDDQIKLENVLSTDKRLRQVKERVENSVSINAILSALDAATLQGVQIKSLSVERKDDATYVVDASLTTDSFNSVMYQREKYEENEILGGIDISNVAIEVPSEEAEAIGFAETVVNFRAEISIPAEKIRAVAGGAGNASVRAGFVSPARTESLPVQDSVEQRATSSVGTVVSTTSASTTTP